MASNSLNINDRATVIVQIATPQCIGVGFVLSQYQLIVTHFHIVEGNPKVVIYGQNQVRHLVDVLFTDDVYDLAFLEIPSGFEVEATGLATTVDKDDTVFLKEKNFKEGKIVNSTFVIDGLSYIQTNIPIDTAYSGAPLFNTSGEIIGINTSMIYEDDDTGFAISAETILSTIEAYKGLDSRIATRCINCKLVSAPTTEYEHCADCKLVKVFPTEYAVYEAEGISRTIEKLIASIGHQPELSRRGLSRWALVEGSATIFLSYYEPRGYILGDAVLCSLPDDKVITEKIYEFLLRQNYEIKGLTFSIRENDIVLSLIIYDRHLNTNTAIELLQTLMERADYYDNVLVEEYGAVWKV